VKTSVTVVDRGWKTLLQTAKQLSKRSPYVKVGVLGGPKNRRPGENLTNVELAIIHEFGAPRANIPERSFIRAPWHVKRKEYVDLLRLFLQATLTRGAMTVHKALSLVGERIAADFKQSAPGTPPPNAPSTLARKLSKTRPGSEGSPKTLMDTGRLIGSISYEVIDA